jgi:hypothetical protein
MKTALIVSSIASVAAFSFPDVQAHVDSHVKSHMKELKSKASVKSHGDFAVEAIKDDVEVESHKGNFEMAFGMSCSDLTVKVSGYQTGICVNVIDGDDSAGGSYGQSFSYKIVKGAGGIPHMEYHYGHQCRYYIGEFPYLDPMGMGFPSDYQIGTCHAFLGPDGTTPMYFGKLSWTPMLMDPAYPYVRRAVTNKARNCDKMSKFYRYDVERTDIPMCYDHDNDDGTTTYYAWDATDCINGVMRRNFFLDAGCSVYNHTRDYYKRYCEFDTTNFLENFEEGESANIEYVYQDCGAGVA